MLLIVFFKFSIIILYKEIKQFKNDIPGIQRKGQKKSPGFVVMSSKGDSDPHGSLPLRFRDSCEGSFNSVLFKFLIMSRLF